MNEHNNHFDILKIVLLIVGSLIVLLLVFQLGMMVGFKKARFSYRWGENYHKNFGGPRNGFMQDFKGKDFINAHGVVGQVIKIDQGTLIIKGRDNIEKMVMVNDKTTVERFRETINLGDLKMDDMIVVIGEPNETGQIEAKFIRVMPLRGKDN